jgi:hypothetical protein
MIYQEGRRERPSLHMHDPSPCGATGSPRSLVPLLTLGPILLNVGHANPPTNVLEKT